MSATDRAEAPEARAFLGPDFLGIGAPRCGTTMLDRLLRTHPALSLPRYTKEVHFFDERHALGLDWYEDQFEPDEGDGCLRGEVTPHYLADDGAFARIEALEARPRFLVMLRDPVDRMVSRYRHGRRRKSETASFREVASRTRPSAAGDYAASLERWFEVFSRERFLVLIYERATQDRDGLAAALGAHLGVDPAGFDTSVLEERVNAGVSGEYFGRAPVLRGAKNALLSLGLDRFEQPLRRAANRYLTPLKHDPGTADDAVSEEDRRWLGERYLPSVERLEALLGEAVPEWPLGGARNSP